jgi:glycosyltransferase involved in cell wall biosynthesis
VWDVPLLGGYDHEFLPSLDHLLPRRWRENQPAWSLWRPINYGLFRRLRRGKFDALWIHGYARAYHWGAMLEAWPLGIKVLMRDDATGIGPSGNRAYKFVKQLIFHLAGQLMDGVLPICTPTIDYYRNLGFPDRKIFMMPYTVDNQFFQDKADEASAHREDFRRSLGLEPDRPVVLFSGKFQPRKRASDLIKAIIAAGPTLPAAGRGRRTQTTNRSRRWQDGGRQHPSSRFPEPVGAPRVVRSRRYTSPAIGERGFWHRGQRGDECALCGHRY